MVVFDMAGTTVNEDNVVYKTLHRAVEQAGLDISLKEVLRLGAGKEKKQAIQDILLEYGADFDDIEEIFQKFKILLDVAYSELSVAAMPGAEDVFHRLRARGVKVVLNTGYDNQTANRLLSKLHWEKGSTYDLLVTADMVPASRPYPDMIYFAMKYFNIQEKLHVVKVGDSIVDIEEGKQAGIGTTIGITTGAHTYEQLQSANPTLIIDQLASLEEVLDWAH